MVAGKSKDDRVARDALDYMMARMSAIVAMKNEDDSTSAIQSFMYAARQLSGVF